MLRRGRLRELVRVAELVLRGHEAEEGGTEDAGRRRGASTAEGRAQGAV
jgi:hypothetical protein